MIRIHMNYNKMNTETIEKDLYSNFTISKTVCSQFITKALSFLSQFRHIPSALDQTSRAIWERR